MSLAKLNKLNYSESEIGKTNLIVHRDIMSYNPTLLLSVMQLRETKKRSQRFKQNMRSFSFQTYFGLDQCRPVKADWTEQNKFLLTLPNLKQLQVLVVWPKE